MPSEKILAEKQQAVATLADDLRDAKSIVFSDYQGLDVAQDTEMRKAFREEGLNYRVVKNTLTRRALEELGYEGLEDELKGPTALAWSNDDVVLAPRMVQKYAKEFKKTEIKGGIVNGEVAELSLIQALADIPSLETLYGQLVFALNFPLTSLAMTLNAMAKKGEEEGKEQVADLVVPKEEAPAEEPAEEAAPAEEAEE